MRGGKREAAGTHSRILDAFLLSRDRMQAQMGGGSVLMVTVFSTLGERLGEGIDELTIYAMLVVVWTLFLVLVVIGSVLMWRLRLL